MFGKLKAKLKEKLAIFSRKAEEEAEVKEEIIEEVIEKKQISADELLEEVKVEDEKEELEVEEAIEKHEIKVEKPVEVFEEVAEEKEVILEKEEPEVVEEKEVILEKEEPEVVEEKEVILEKEEPEVVEEVKKVEIIKERKPEDKPKKQDLPTVESLIEETKKKFEKEDPEKKTKKEVIEEKKREVKEEIIIEEPKKEKTSLFSRFKKALTTKTISADKFEELFWELEVTLLENNVSVEVIEKIKEDLKKELVDQALPRDVNSKILDTLKNTLDEILTFDKVDLLSNIKKKKPYVIAFFGINGSGKTTSIAKLTHYFKEKGHSVVLAACDTFRAAAIQQLEEHANRLDVKIIKHDYGSDAAAVAFDAVKYAEKNGIDIVLIDTAGRLHSNTNLMAELEKLIRVSKPDFKIFVGESITGNDCIEQARKFNDLVEQDGIILTKVDVDDKGGTPLSISYVINKPILFFGMGQNYEDFEAFDKEKILERLGL
ncbi:MAG: signal recognition particle-docking protein FtsY [Candidatus Woesearchaeota archaeon]